MIFKSIWKDFLLMYVGNLVFFLAKVVGSFNESCISFQFILTWNKHMNEENSGINQQNNVYHGSTQPHATTL